MGEISSLSDKQNREIWPEYKGKFVRQREWDLSKNRQ